MIGRLSRSEDFERALGSRSRVSSVHFAVHHLVAGPAARRRLRGPGPPRLSTGQVEAMTTVVDDSFRQSPPAASAGPVARVWFGTVVPKRHARRAVTRTLLKRQMHRAVAGHGADMPAGIWVLRLRAPFDRVEFPSAASRSLKIRVRAELAELLDAAVAKATPGASHRPPDGRRR